MMKKKLEKKQKNKRIKNQIILNIKKFEHKPYVKVRIKASEKQKISIKN